MAVFRVFSQCIYVHAYDLYIYMIIMLFVESQVGKDQSDISVVVVLSEMKEIIFYLNSLVKRYGNGK